MAKPKNPLLDLAQKSRLTKDPNSRLLAGTMGEDLIYEMPEPKRDMSEKMVERNSASSKATATEPMSKTQPMRTAQQRYQRHRAKSKNNSSNDTEPLSYEKRMKTSYY